MLLRSFGGWHPGSGTHPGSKCLPVLKVGFKVGKQFFPACHSESSRLFFSLLTYYIFKRHAFSDPIVHPSNSPNEHASPQCLETSSRFSRSRSRTSVSVHGLHRPGLGLHQCQSTSAGSLHPGSLPSQSSHHPRQAQPQGPGGRRVNPGPAPEKSRFGGAVWERQERKDHTGVAMVKFSVTFLGSSPPS